MFDYLDALAGATSLDNVWELHCDAMAGFGFDRLIYGYTRFSSTDSLGAYEDALFLTNHDPAYIEGFLGNRLLLSAPLLRWGRENVGACSWGAIWRGADSLSPAERKVIAFNEAMGVSAGYSICFAEADPRDFGMISLTARPGLSQDDVERIWAVDGRQIEAMNNMAHLKIRSLPHASARSLLTERQSEVLGWVAKGKSNQDIAQILEVSVATVEKHLRLVRSRLGVDTTAQALIKAMFLNQIDRP